MRLPIGIETRHENMITSKFLDTVRAEKLDGIWQLLAPLRYQSEVLGAMIEIPSGYVTDFVSVPRLPFMYLIAGNTAHAAAVLHDMLYQLHLPGIDRAVADSLLYEAMVASGEPRWRAWSMWMAVRLVGWAAWRSGPGRFQVLGGQIGPTETGASSSDVRV